MSSPLSIGLAAASTLQLGDNLSVAALADVDVISRPRVQSPTHALDAMLAPSPTHSAHDPNWLGDDRG